MSKLRQRTRHMLYAGLAGAAAVGVVFAGYAAVSGVRHHAKENEIREEYRRQIAKLEQARLNEEKQMVSGWALARDVAAGETVTPKDLVRVKLPQGAAPANLLESGGDGEVKIAKIELRKGTALTDAMVYVAHPLQADLRNRELQAIVLPSDLRQHDVVDVRIQFPTGQDYIILSKKKIDKLLNPAMWIQMTEQEMLALSSAMVDAYLHDAKLYAVTYVEPEMQDKAVPTYPVNKEVLKLIASDPNIVNRAERKLSESIRAALEKDLEKAAPDKAAGSFAESEFAPSGLSAGLYPGSTGSAGQDRSGSAFRDATSSNGNMVEPARAGSNSAEGPSGDLSAADSSQDSFFLGDVQDNKLLEKSIKEKQGSGTPTSDQP
ncbi:SAF domain-containing protein [Paenibacillus sp. VCA1]|uniref:SAF domain-containing protein n=1 Tax=Paenibacillus sp. VCA1 TaxID=3039148 RepID=UPI002870E72D|nr:SAF domain-containing protein [Paenibacillus sp. VCA1]MDR9854100.1 SAF domain-containing protein [Paenibacillus sp. VCA1]